MIIKQKIEKIVSNQKKKLLSIKEKVKLMIPVFHIGTTLKREVKKFSKEKITLIGSSIFIKGVVSGSENLYIYGTVEGKIVLGDNTLIIEPEGKVLAEIQVERITINGNASGNIYAKDLVAINKTGSFKGDIFSPRISIAEGAHFEGNVKIEKTADLLLPISDKITKKKKTKEKN